MVTKPRGREGAVLVDKLGPWAAAPTGHPIQGETMRDKVPAALGTQGGRWCLAPSE